MTTSPARTSVERVVFDGEGESLVGNLYRPATPETRAVPAVVVTGSWCTVKEQMAGRYARGLAERGYVSLAFDFRGYGESGGQPRDLESPDAKIRDIQDAVTYLGTTPGADPDRIGALGICAGAGYTAGGVAADDRVQSLALVAPWLHDRALVEAVYGGSDGVHERITAGQEALLRYRQTGEVDYVPAVSTTDQRAAMYGPFDYYLDQNRGAIPAWGNRFAVMAWSQWLEFDPIEFAPGITVPTVMVHSEDGAIPDGARRFHADLGAPGQLHWITGSQFDFYDDEPTVEAALRVVDAHYRDTL
ncbi:MAG: alpha/beta hydrolase [Pseudonocardiaceae bacterium]